MNHDRRHRLWSLFEMIAESSPEGSGALHFEGSPLGGVVLFEVGRVCWAAAPGAGRRLTDLVCEHARVSRTELQITYAECRDRGRPLGETLVERKLIEADLLRSLLLQQTSETLIALAERDDDPVWIPHRGRGYAPRFTFAVPEVIASTMARGLSLDPEAARRELAEIVEGVGIGAAFDLDGEPLPIAVARDSDDYDALRALGDWVATMMWRWTAVSPSERAPSFIVGDTGSGSLVAWQQAGFNFGARFTGTSGLSRALARLMRRT